MNVSYSNFSRSSPHPAPPSTSYVSHLLSPSLLLLAPPTALPRYSTRPIMSPEPTQHLSVLTFNMLAPCYKRLFNENGIERSDREADHESLWTSRLTAILHLLTSISPTPDIIALQEVWFHPPFISRFEEILKPHYHIFYAQRPGSKKDGLATLVRRDESLNPPVHIATFPLANGDRIGLAVSVTLPSTVLCPSSPLLLVNAHLTFPHGPSSRRLRATEVEALTAFVASHTASPPLPVLVLGDFNGDTLSPVCRRMVQDQFVNCYTSINGPTALPKTHYNHQREQVFVDHVFLRNPQPQKRRRSPSPEPTAVICRFPNHPRRSRTLSLAPRSVSPSPVAIREMANHTIDHHCASYVSCAIEPVAAAVYPETLPNDVWPVSFKVSDHRPVGILFRRNLLTPVYQ